MRQAVVSSNLRAVGYDASQQTLEIEFNNGSIYRYTGVPKSIHESLMSAESHGRYFNAYIRDRFPTVRIL